MTKVVHCKREKYDVYIGRPSIWGNPFEIGKDGTREEVIDKYRQLMSKRLTEGTHTVEWKLCVRQLKGKTLGCWCAPKPCHGDVLAELADNLEE